MKTKTLLAVTTLFFTAALALPSFVTSQILYGMTADGGTTGDGVIFQYNAATNTYTKKFDFTGANGAHPSGSFIRASDGNLYGMTAGGGANGGGVLFSFNPVTSAYIDKFDFGATGATGSTNAGSNPQGSLVKASDGNFYGMTNMGGQTGKGVLFQFNPVNSTYTKKHDFALLTGDEPNGSLVQATDGNLYGMTYEGGTGSGVIFEFNPASSIYTVKVNLTTARGSNPKGSLMQASDGNLYGMTWMGGANNAGVIFKFDPSASVYTKQFDFIAATGELPSGDLIQATDGNLYGMTGMGGSLGQGVIFKFNPVTSVYSKIVDCIIATGDVPQGSLMQASDGYLYGMTSFAGTNSNNNIFDGSLFQLDPVSSTYTVKFTFDKINGSSPLYSNLLEVSPTTSLVPTLSQWALITLSVLVLVGGVVFVRERVV